MASLVVLSSIVGVVTAGHALHASWTQLEHLWRTDVKAVEQIRSVIQSVNELNGVLQRYVSSWETHVDGTTPPGGDPTAAYSLVRHVAEGWTQVDEALHRFKEIFGDIEHLATRADREPLPNADDVAGASEAVARLAHVYCINATTLTHGGHLLQAALTGCATLEAEPPRQHHTLSVVDLASIGMTALNKDYFSVGVEFLRAARSRAAAAAHTQHHWFSEDLSINKLDSLLTTAVRVHDHVLEMRGPRSLTHATAPTPYGGGQLENGGRAGWDGGAVVGVEYLKLHGNKTWMLQERPLVEQQQIEQLCRGRDLRTTFVTSQLRCRYASGGSPWLLLAPFKVEQLSLDPYISLIYEVVSPREAAEVKEGSREHLHLPVNARKGNAVNDTTRDWSLKHELAVPMSRPGSVWLEEAGLTSLQKLGRRLSHVTRVSLHDLDSEPYMVADYGLGGEYGAHRDTHGPARTPPHRIAGERMATFLTYLEAPAAGGRTVFPWVGVGVGGVERATIVWWNLLASHEHDFLTRHAACPVLHGHKWILTKWAGYLTQWRAQPCPADPSRKVLLPWR
ncbi:prolyl 4-hydroxylase subunit alpha-3-like isoform X2 [Panulirus ornatus]|uniref:prolyl 4-hydroxylase subunit alpha-3-like isoform X2 n=1 Tax=Panulirus ornatus TaxID=150431 RepID=UPI003A89D74E